LWAKKREKKMIENLDRLVPIGCGVIVDIEPTEEDATVNGIILPDSEEKFAQFRVGTIEKLGPSAFRYLDEDEINFKVGSRVVIVKNAGFPLSKDGYVDRNSKKGGPYVVNDEDIKLVWREENE
jgi:co-chaperonin GroES (HSP10)